MVTRISKSSTFMFTVIVETIFVAGAFYWLEWYQAALWSLTYSIVYSILVALRSIIRGNEILGGRWRPE